MVQMVYIYRNFLVSWLGIFAIGLSGCASSENTDAPRPSPGNKPTTIGSNTSDSSKPDELLTDDLFVGKSTTLDLKFPRRHPCVDGTTPITWELTNADGKASLTNPDKCVPTIVTTDSFADNEVTLKSDLRNSAGQLIRWQVAIRLKHAPEIESNVTISNSPNAAAGGAIPMVLSQLAWQNATSNRASHTDPYETVTVGGETLARIPIFVDNRHGAPASMGAAHLYLGNRNFNREFAVGVGYSDHDGDDSALVPTVTCKLENDQLAPRFFPECPLIFDPIGQDKQIRFRFKPATAEDAATPFGTGNFRLKNVFHTAINEKKILIVLEVRHPNTSEVSSKVIGKLTLRVFTYGNGD